MLLKDTIDIIKRIEEDCGKEINVIRFSELNPGDIHEIVFVPEFYYDDVFNCDYKNEDYVNDDGFEPGGTD